MSVTINGTTGIDTIQDGIVTTAKIATSAVSTAKIAADAVTTPKIADTVNLGRRNIIINGDMRIAQRGTTATSAVGQNYYYCSDRFKKEASGDIQLSISQATDAPDGFIYSQKFTVTTIDTTVASSSFCQTLYRIEANDFGQTAFGTSGAKSLSLSFWVKASQTGVYPITLSNHSGNRNYPMSYTVNSANTWEKKTLSISGDTSGGWNLTGNVVAAGIRFGQYYGSTYSGATANSWNGNSSYSSSFVTHTNNFNATLSATWQITGVQLEVGDTATPFEHRSYGEELSLCQRYYQFIDSVSTAGQGANLMFHRYYDSQNVYASSYQYFTPMRAAPSITFESGMRCHLPAISVESGTFGSSSISNQGAWLQVTPGSTNNSSVRVALIDGDGTNSKKVFFDAEL